MTTILHDRVAGYATEVRRHLADLAPEVVDELTEGLEADLAEELAERTEGGPGPGDGEEQVLDVVHVFGPAAAYAAELRSAAGLAPAVPVRRRRPVREALREQGGTWRARGGEVLDEVRRLPGGRWALESLVALRPVWWVARGWVLSVLVVSAFSSASQTFVPLSPGGWFVLVVLVALSVLWGRGGGHRYRAVRWAFVAAHVVALVALVPVVNGALDRATWAGQYIGGPTEYIEVPVDVAAAPTDGVVVDGMYVSNLFVYDADGNPLTDVQIVDDRGRPVRTITDGSMSDWALPGVDGAWAFVPREDTAGRERWNVYPLSGAPSDRWTWDDATGTRAVDPAELREPPAPFAKAPALVPQHGGGDQPAAETGDTTAPSGGPVSPSPSASPSASPSTGS